MNELLLNEAKGKGVQLVVLSNLKSTSTTVESIKKECSKRGIKHRIININRFKIKPLKGGSSFSLDDDNEDPIIIHPDNTVVLCRAAVAQNTKSMSLVSLLEDNRFFVVNSLSSITACRNKYVTSKILQDNKIPVPKMALLVNEDQIDDAVEDIGGKFPLVMKLLDGTHGIGVSVVESASSLRSILQTIWKLTPNTEILLQEKIESSYDLRIHVLVRNPDSNDPKDAEVIASMKRSKVKKDFRTNFSLGGKVSDVKITPEQEKMAIISARAIGCQWCGVDIIVDEKTGKNFVLEINSSPGTVGITKASGIDVLGAVLDFIFEKSNWMSSKMVAGFRESIEIPGIGKFVAKLDTGNGSIACSITYDDMKIDGKNVTWRLGKKTIKSKIMGVAKTEVGTEIQERKFIELDIIFAGKKYEKVQVALVDRSDKSTPFLINRQFLQRIGCTVDPLKTFLLSEKPEGYKPQGARGEPHAGIEFHEEE